MKLIDFHTHPVLKPFNSSLITSEKKNLWDEFDVPASCTELCSLIQKSVKETDKQSQSDFTKVNQGGVNGIFIAMGAVERPFFKPRVKNILLPLLLPKKQYKNLACCITGFSMKKTNKIFECIAANKGVDYFNSELQPEFEYLRQQEQASVSSAGKFEIATDYEHFIRIINTPNTIAVVLTIEGAQAFGNYEYDSDFEIPFDEVQQMKDYTKFKFIENIQTVKKNWNNYSPFFVTLCHHFWNLLSGHSKSMSPSTLLPGMDAIIDQLPNMDAPITNIGKQVIHELLSRENGRRILIDIKHMSVKTRKWYYDLVKQRRAAGDTIPIICSHTSVNLYETMEDASAVTDDFCKEKYAYLSRFSINLSNDEITAIAESNGIIGIILNEERMPGQLGKDAIKACGEGMNEAKRNIYVKLIMCNILQIVKVVNKKEAWDLICIGSDFDGIIAPFETYMDSRTLKDLPDDIIQYLFNPQFDLDWIGVTANDIKTKYLFGYTAQEIGEKIASKNVMLFLENYFHDNYLRTGSNRENNITM